MKIEEFVNSIRARNAKAFDQLPDKRAMIIVRSVLREIATQIDSADTAKGVVFVPLLGRFSIKMIEREGKPVKKRIGLRRIKMGKAKPGKAKPE